MIQSPRYCTQMKKHTCHDHMIFHGCVNITANYISMGIALLVFTQQIYYHGVGVRHPSYVIHPFICLPIIRKLRFLRNCHMDPDQIKFYGKLPIHHITRLFLSYFLQVSNFHIFFFVSLTWAPIGAKIAKRYSSHKSLLNLLKLPRNFCLQYPHKVTFSDY